MITTLLPSIPRWLRPVQREQAQSPLSAADGRICAWPWTVAALIVVAGVVLFYGLGTFRTLGSHEIYAVVPAREMIETDNWILPKFGGLPRLRKPPLAYWIVAASGKLFGELNPLTARLPSAITGLLLAGLMGLWAKRWYGPSVGWAAAFVQLTSVWFLIFARKAEIDMVLCLLTTSALFLVAHQPLDESRRRSHLRWLAFFGLLSLAWLAKFHYGPALVLGPVLAYLVIEKRWQRLMEFVNPLGWICFAAALAVWPLLVLEQAPNALEIWRRETLGRALGEMGTHHILFYVPFLIWMPMPWTFFAVASVRESWQSAWNKKDSRERFLWVWFLVQLLILTLSANKHKHYLLAMLPVVTLLAARGLSRILHGFQRGQLKLTPYWLNVCLTINLAAGAGLGVLVHKQWPALTAQAWILGITVSCCQGAGWLLLARRRVMAVIAVNVLSVAVGGWVIINDILPHCDRRVDVQAFASEIRHSQLPDECVYVYRMDRDPLVYHLGSPVLRSESRDDLLPKLKTQVALFVVGYEWQIQELVPAAQAQHLARLPKGSNEREPVEGDVVLVKLTHRDSIDQKN